MNAYCRSSASEPLETLPVQIISNILLRLPIKTLCGLKCVCKGWRTLISSPQFTESFQKQSNCESQLLICTDSLFTISLEELLHIPCSPTKLELPTDPKYLMYVVGSSNGLLCVLQYPSTFFLLNPTTRESITLRPDPGYPVKLCGSGHVALADDYRVVKVSSSSMVRVYSAKTNSWKHVRFDFPYSDSAYSGNKPVYVNGVVYWMISDSNTPLHNTIVEFDLIEENFKEIQLPGSMRQLKPYHTVVNMGVLKGYLCVSLEMYPECFELWIMLKEGEGQTWNRDFILPYYAWNVALKRLLPVCLLQGQILIQVDNRYLFLFDLLNRKFQQLKLRLPQGPCCKFRGCVYEEDEPCCAFRICLYERSIVSPRGYFWLDKSRLARLGQ